MSLGGGDQLARGAKSANFNQSSSLSDFENDLIFRPESVAAKYGLTEYEVQKYQDMRQSGEKLPDLKSVAVLNEEKEIKVVDKRHNYLMETAPGLDAKPVEAVEQKWPEQKFTSPKPILDRILVKRVADDPNLEVLEDGSVRDKSTGIIQPSKYRQHQNIGIVLAVGEFVVVGGQRTPLSEVVKPGDRVMYGEYNAESFDIKEEMLRELCDSVRMNYFPDPNGTWIVRVQDVRMVEKPVSQENPYLLQETKDALDVAMKKLKANIEGVTLEVV